MLRRSIVVATGAVIAAAVLLAGCSGDGPNPVDTAPQIVMTIATDDDNGQLLSAQQINHLVARIDELSQGRFIIQPDWAANGDVEQDWDQAIARRAIDGRSELALVPSRAWDTLGVTSLQALSVPMLITSQELEANVLTSDVAPKLVSGLRRVGVTGISLFPEALRHPFGLQGPVVAPSDFDGGLVRVPRSNASTLLYSALGATAVEGEPDAATMIAQDTDYGRDPDGTATGNLTWYPKVNVLVANTERLASLTATQRAWLNRAARDTQNWAIKALPTDRQAAATWCASGGTIVAATAGQLSQFRTALEPVRRALVADSLTADLTAKIEQMSSSVTAPDPVTACPGT